MKIKTILFVLVILLSATLFAQKDDVYLFPFPTIPANLDSPTDRAQYLSFHFWDNVIFSDSILNNNPSYIEQGWVDFTSILSFIPLNDAKKAIQLAFKKVQNNESAFNFFMSLANKYQFNMDSPLRNEEYYIAALEFITTFPNITFLEKKRYSYLLYTANKNKIGTKATDFTFNTLQGVNSLYAIKSNYTLLFIHDFDCHTCQLELKKIKNSKLIQQKIKDKKITVLTFYPYEEVEEWKKRQKNYDPQWINGYDATYQFIEKELYFLRSSSSFYFLDTNKKVLLKDTSIENIEAYIKNN